MLEQIGSKLNVSHKTQRIDGSVLNIPAIKKDYILDFYIDGQVNGITYSQSGWRWEDTWDLYIDDNLICNQCRTKEIGEHKYFNGFINAHHVKFIYHNVSATSKIVWVDLEYLGKPVENPISLQPTIDNISNEWDVSVEMNWEGNTGADIDLHGYIDDLHVYHGNKQEKDFYLNYDFTSHDNNINPEILSVKGYKNKTLEVYVRNFNGVNLSKPITIKIYQNSISKKLLKEIDVSLDNNKEVLKGVCSINLKTLQINNLNKNKIIEQ